MTVVSAINEDIHVGARSPLSPGNAVGAIIVLDNGKYLLQLRDRNPKIFFPGHWSLFGGAMDPGEDEPAALARELEEEIGLTGISAPQLMRFDFDLRSLAQVRFYRSYFEIRLPMKNFDRLILGEGEAMGAFTPEEVLQLPRVAPYDAFALWLHINRFRLKTS